MIEAISARPAVPGCLANGTAKNWREDEILDALWPMFGQKCYLTEHPIGTREFEVDHRHPKASAGAPDSLDWENLYPISHFANQTRVKGWPVGGLLHPDGRDRIDSRIIQKLEYDAPKADVLCLFVPIDSNNAASANTCKELHRCHHRDDISTDGRAKNLRQAILFQLTMMLEASVPLVRVDRPSRDKLAEQEFKSRYASKSSPYFALVRSKIPKDLDYLIER